MIESLIITLREGIEAALVVVIVLAYLKKTNRSTLSRSVYVGVILAVIASIAGAIVFQRLTINQEAFEGFVLLVAAIFVGSMIIWMWRTSKGIKREIETKMEGIVTSQKTSKISLGILLFTFVMIFREGVETVIFLSAVSLSTDSILNFLGGILGLALAVAFGIAFLRGSLRIDLGRFFKVTSVILLIFVVQLLVNAFHELSEAQILPASEREMALVGPIVRNNIFFVIAIISIPLVMFLIPSKERPHEIPDSEEMTVAERRKAKARVRSQFLWRTFTSMSGLAVILFLIFGFIYSSSGAGLSPAEPAAAQDGFVRISTSKVDDGNLHRFGYDTNGRTVRFLIIKIDTGKFGVAFDACEICGDHGYYQEGPNVICKNCLAEIYTPTIGKGGGCNPIELPSRLVGDEIIISVDELNRGAVLFGG